MYTAVLSDGLLQLIRVTRRCVVHSRETGSGEDWWTRLKRGCEDVESSRTRLEQHRTESVCFVRSAQRVRGQMSGRVKDVRCRARGQRLAEEMKKGERKNVGFQAKSRRFRLYARRASPGPNPAATDGTATGLRALPSAKHGAGGAHRHLCTSIFSSQASPWNAGSSSRSEWHGHGRGSTLMVVYTLHYIA